jgi:transcriptional regulator with XRE-family HTH domain
MNTLSEALRELMDRQKMTGARLAEEIGISGTSVSQILTGKTRPRQVTLSRMMKRLCENPRDEQVLLSAYESLSGENVPVSPVVDDEANAATEEARVRRFMEMKAQSIAFKRSVARELDKAGIEFTADYCKGAISTDFLIEANGQRIALECRFNVQRDLDRAVITAKVLREALVCDTVITVTPFDISDTAPADTGFVTATPSDAIELMRKALRG